MATIHDYLYWRGDLLLHQDPLNETDCVILTRFSYMPLERFEMEPNETVGSLCEKLKQLPETEFRLEGDLHFATLVGASKRFNAIPVSDFVKHNDFDEVVQFAAITFYLPDGTLYIAYCGTDSTLVGWKEDFYMSFTEDIPAQLEALNYTQSILSKNPGKRFRLGGHSKGGNLAIYTAVNLNETEKARLLEARNFDGPGFPNSYIETHDFRSVLSRLHTYIPQQSMFGRIHEHAEGFRVVESTESGIRQHDVYSWVVEPTGLKFLEKPDDSSEIMYFAIQNILSMTSPQQRKEFVDRVFDSLATASDTEIFAEAVRELPQRLNEVYKITSNFSSEERKENTEMMTAMVKSYLSAAFSYHEKKLTDFGEVIGKLTTIIPDSGNFVSKMTNQSVNEEEKDVEEEQNREDTPAHF